MAPSDEAQRRSRCLLAASELHRAGELDTPTYTQVKYLVMAGDENTMAALLAGTPLPPQQPQFLGDLSSKTGKRQRQNPKALGRALYVLRSLKQNGTAGVDVVKAGLLAGGAQEFCSAAAKYYDAVVPGPATSSDTEGLQAVFRAALASLSVGGSASSAGAPTSSTLPHGHTGGGHGSADEPKRPPGSNYAPYTAYSRDDVAVVLRKVRGLRRRGHITAAQAGWLKDQILSENPFIVFLVTETSTAAILAQLPQIGLPDHPAVPSRLPSYPSPAVTTTSASGGTTPANGGMPSVAHISARLVEIQRLKRTGAITPGEAGAQKDALLAGPSTAYSAAAPTGQLATTSSLSSLSAQLSVAAVSQGLREIAQLKRTGRLSTTEAGRRKDELLAAAAPPDERISHPRGLSAVRNSPATADTTISVATVSAGLRAIAQRRKGGQITAEQAGRIKDALLAGYISAEEASHVKDAYGPDATDSDSLLLQPQQSPLPPWRTTHSISRTSSSLGAGGGEPGDRASVEAISAGLREIAHLKRTGVITAQDAGARKDSLLASPPRSQLHSSSAQLARQRNSLANTADSDAAVSTLSRALVDIQALKRAGQISTEEAGRRKDAALLRATAEDAGSPLSPPVSTATSVSPSVARGGVVVAQTNSGFGSSSGGTRRGGVVFGSGGDGDEDGSAAAVIAMPVAPVASPEAVAAISAGLREIRALRLAGSITTEQAGARKNELLATAGLNGSLQGQALGTAAPVNQARVAEIARALLTIRSEKANGLLTPAEATSRKMAVLARCV